MLEKLKKIRSDVSKLIISMDKKDIMGPIGFLEECLENVEAAIDDYLLYIEDGEEVDED